LQQFAWILLDLFVLTRLLGLCMLHQFAWILLEDDDDHTNDVVDDDDDHDLSNSSRHGANGGSILSMPSGYFRHPGTHPHMEIIQASWPT
jgi:hypothetical protein